MINDCDLRNIILAMYTTKQLRGNTIPEADRNNDACDLISLAQALIKGEVIAIGAYLQVEV